MKLIVGISMLLSLSIWAQDSAFDTVDNSLTLEDEAASQNYIHEGQAQTTYNELCFDENGQQKEICQDSNSAFDGFMGTMETLMPAVTKAYALVVGVGGGGNFTARNLSENGERQFKFENEDKPRPLKPEEQAAFDENGKVDGATESTEQKKDYCGYIATVGEGVSTAMVALQNDKIEQNFQAAQPEARQAASLYSLADNQKAMRKGADMQFYVWGASAGCYAVYALQAQFQGDWKVYAKLAGSTLIATFYKLKAKAHKEREQKLREMAAELPQAGDCNPYTQTSCFCAEPTSGAADPANYRKYCIPDALVARAAPGGEPVPCVNQQGKIDTACKCKQSRTCIDRALRVAGVDIGLDPVAMKNPLEGISALSSGFDDGRLDAAARRNLAFAEKALKKLAPQNLNNLNNKQRKEARDLAKLGLTPTAARSIAKLPSSRGSSSLPPSMQLAALGGNKALAKNKIKNKITKNKDSGFKTVGKMKRKSKQKDPLAALRKKRRKKTSMVDIERFAEKATSQAGIRFDSSKNLFDIISYRYKASAWKQFPQALSDKENQK